MNPFSIYVTFIYYVEHFVTPELFSKFSYDYETYKYKKGTRIVSDSLDDGLSHLKTTDDFVLIGWLELLSGTDFSIYNAICNAHAHDSLNDLLYIYDGCHLNVEVSSERGADLHLKIVEMVYIQLLVPHKMIRSHRNILRMILEAE